MAYQVDSFCDAFGDSQ